MTLSVVADRRRTGGAAARVASVLLVRVGLALLGAVIAVAGAVFLYRASMKSSQWGPFLADAGPVTIVRYSTPWIAAAAGAVLVAGLLVTAAVTDLVRWRRVRRAARAHRDDRAAVHVTPQPT